MRLLGGTIERVWLDVVVVALFAFWVGEVFLSEDIEGAPVPLIAFSLIWGLPLLARRRAPVLAPALVIAGVTAQALIWPRSVPYSFATFMVIAISAGLLGAALRGTWPRLLGAAGLLVAVIVVVFRDPDGSPTNLLSVIPTLGVAWLIGHLYRVNARRTAELRERAERLERERETEARAAVAEERARIAREMHDVVAHSLSVMVVQAEAAEAMLDTDPERARRPLGAVQDTGRGALTELRRMLGVLREMADEDPALAPQPGLAELDALVGQVRAAGLPVEVSVAGDPRPLPPGIDLSAYRIVQEGLTNALKHAGPARAHVALEYGPRELRLEVSDDGRGHDPSDDGLGHGLLGMRERVACYGGDLQAGPRDDAAGFALRARLPLDAGAAS
ncbi:sensor histidine kinase [Miltoncostaea oceani]|jgi:signal transduction histidine kinase|uniref:sensor histidine kinase n=1 Tax=Miltoncostaea oceani TaxID=2843216 RepID=UPI001C3D1A28|nr:sensor histidine kinase [Miltoncostaea oceani]